MKLISYPSLCLLLILLAFTACNNGTEPGNQGYNGPTVPSARTMTYSVLTSYPHDTSFYTQGLEFYKGRLLEGTGSGSFAGSFLMEVDLKTGKALRRHTLGEEFFGEGITVVNDTVYQLTYQNRKVFSYSVSDFKKIAEFPLQHEGWGLTNNGRELIASDGSNRLYYYEPGSFRLLRTQTVTDGGAPVLNINELEFVNGFIYANQYQYPYILKIDPDAGTVVAKADMTDLWTRTRNLKPDADVLNGIAYDSSRQTFFVTGKLWPEMYEVKFSE
ncbi:MAG: glutaminyl-peptide cyclotransferase [Chitinophagaceae bacterium]|nr:glutaminyl-peptide cyclotransferase [Chitinophagaceae bacterium]